MLKSISIIGLVLLVLTALSVLLPKPLRPTKSKSSAVVVVFTGIFLFLFAGYLQREKNTTLEAFIYDLTIGKVKKNSESKADTPSLKTPDLISTEPDSSTTTQIDVPLDSIESNPERATKEPEALPEKQNKEQIAYTTGDLNVRNQPSGNGLITTVLLKGDEVEILDSTHPTWYKIATESNHVGYVSRYYLSVPGPNTPSKNSENINTHQEQTSDSCIRKFLYLGGYTNALNRNDAYAVYSAKSRYFEDYKRNSGMINVQNTDGNICRTIRELSPELLMSWGIADYEDEDQKKYEMAVQSQSQKKMWDYLESKRTETYSTAFSNKIKNWAGTTQREISVSKLLGASFNLSSQRDWYLEVGRLPPKTSVHFKAGLMYMPNLQKEHQYDMRASTECITIQMYNSCIANGFCESQQVQTVNACIAVPQSSINSICGGFIGFLENSQGVKATVSSWPERTSTQENWHCGLTADIGEMDRYEQ